MEYSTGKCNLITILSLVIMHPLHTASGVVVPCLGSVGWPNSSKRARCCQKRQSSGDRKKFCHIWSFFLLGLLCDSSSPPTCQRIDSQKRRFPGVRRVSLRQLS